MCGFTVPYIKQKFRLALYGEVGFGFSRESLRGFEGLGFTSLGVRGFKGVGHRGLNRLKPCTVFTLTLPYTIIMIRNPQNPILIGEPPLTPSKARAPSPELPSLCMERVQGSSLGSRTWDTGPSRASGWRSSQPKVLHDGRPRNILQSSCNAFFCA